jgi:hypothetical protein
LNPVLCLAENGAQRSRLLGEPDEDLRVLDFKVSYLGVKELLPGVFGRNDCCGLSFRVSRSWAIFKNNRYVSCSDYSMIPLLRSTLQYAQSLSTRRREADITVVVLVIAGSATAARS